MIRTARLACALALALVTSLVVPIAAHAVGYQYWGFYTLVDGEWGTAAMGPDATVPIDGGVDGYRFAVSAGDTPRLPRAVLSFEDICADTPAQDGMKRVGLVIDPGRPADAPQDATPPQPGAQCVVAEQDATSQQVLTQAVGDLRLNDTGLVCAIAGYPQEGCADEVAEPSPEALAADEPVEIPIAAAADVTTSDEATDEASDSDLPPWVWAVGVLVLLGILGGLATVARNRRLAAAQGPDDDQPRPPQEF